MGFKQMGFAYKIIAFSVLERSIKINKEWVIFIKLKSKVIERY